MTRPASDREVLKLMRTIERGGYRTVTRFGDLKQTEHAFAKLEKDKRRKKKV